MSKKLLQAAAGAGGEALYVEDVFSTYLYTGTGATQTITNGIDLDGEGGMVWTKERSPNARNHFIGDSERNNFRNYLYSNLANAESGLSASGYDISSVSSTGYTLGPNNYTWNNESGSDQVSWTFRKAPKFFDVVTYTGTGSAQTIAHNLGSVPACIIIKSTNLARDWAVYHTSTGNGQALTLNNNTAARSFAGWNSTTPTDTEFYLGVDSDVNNGSGTYVAYLFASDAGGFGDDDESIIKCGSFTGGTGGYATVDLGFEPQWIMIKGTTLSSQWVIYDTMRGWVVSDSTADDAYLFANLSNAEGLFAAGEPNATGFRLKDSSTAGETYIYIAIRRPMKTPESGTEVFSAVNRTATAPTYYTGFVTDMQIMTLLNGFQNQLTDRLRGQKKLLTNATDAESAIGTEATYDWMTGVGDQDSASSNNIAWNFKRATGFFDVVAYTGDGVAGSTQAHNLGVVPEMMIVKRRDGVSSWITYWDALGATKGQFLDSNQAFTSSTYWNDTAPTSTEFTLGSGSTNNSGATFIAYLFATLAGVSKVGSYTGNNLDTTIDCGFSNGARFVMIKRTDSTGDWTVFDAARGWSTSTDYWLDLNNTDAEASGNTLTVRSAGFGVRGSPYDAASLNVSGATYIYLAIA